MRKLKLHLVLIHIILFSAYATTGPKSFDCALVLQLSLTRTARTRVHVSQPDVQTQLWRMEGEAATSMRLTLGCGSLDVASLALAA